MFRVRSGRDPVRIQAQLDLGRAAGTAVGLTLLLILVTGIVLGFTGE